MTAKAERHVLQRDTYCHVADTQMYQQSDAWVTNRDATIYRYIVHCIVLSLYRCIDTKSNHVDISCIVTY